MLRILMLRASSRLTLMLRVGFNSNSRNVNARGNEGIIKLTTDGCWYEADERRGFGSIFRDHNGDWIMGFYGKTTCTSSLEAEIWAIFRGLDIILGEAVGQCPDRVGLAYSCESDTGSKASRASSKRYHK